MVGVPGHLRVLAESVVAEAEQDPRMLAVVVGGSVALGTSDEYSDLDLVLVCTPSRPPTAPIVCAR
jgi:predicted nucleotidyltransferase